MKVNLSDNIVFNFN